MRIFTLRLMILAILFSQTWANAALKEIKEKGSQMDFLRDSSVQFSSATTSDELSGPTLSHHQKLGRSFFAVVDCTYKNRFFSFNSQDDVETLINMVRTGGARSVKWFYRETDEGIVTNSGDASNSRSSTSSASAEDSANSRGSAGITTTEDAGSSVVPASAVSPRKKPVLTRTKAERMLELPK